MKKEYLNIGSSEVKIAGCINVDIDISTVTGLDVVGNVLCLPFKDNSFKGVVAHQLFEHLHKREHAFAIRECRRVIAPGGRISVQVPNFEVVLKNYLTNFQGRREFWEFCIFGRQLYTGDIHRCGITEQYLTKLLFENGFADLKWLREIADVRENANLGVVATKTDIEEWSISYGNTNRNSNKHINTA